MSDCAAAEVPHAARSRARAATEVTISCRLNEVLIITSLARNFCPDNRLFDHASSLRHSWNRNRFLRFDKASPHRQGYRLQPGVDAELGKKVLHMCPHRVRPDIESPSHLLVAGPRDKEPKHLSLAGGQTRSEHNRNRRGQGL